MPKSSRSPTPGRPSSPDERRLEALQRQISQANTILLAERNSLLVRMSRNGYLHRDLSARLSRAATAVGDSPLTEDAVQKAIRRTLERSTPTAVAG